LFTNGSSQLCVPVQGDVHEPQLTVCVAGVGVTQAQVLPVVTHGPYEQVALSSVAVWVMLP
jgi:hypothetical protein